ncbi:MAG: hypothetical protein ACKOZU_08280 [Planctomycetaceae bacterium]
MNRGGLREAVEHALAGRWSEAHGIAQAHEGDPLADWLHALLHKIEGDAGNARYWYRRAGKLAHETDESAGELEAIRAALA